MTKRVGTLDLCGSRAFDVQLTGIAPVVPRFAKAHIELKLDTSRQHRPAAPIPLTRIYSEIDLKPILTEIEFGRFRFTAVCVVCLDPLLTAFVVCALVPFQVSSLPRFDTAADIKVTPFFFVLGYQNLGDGRSGCIGCCERIFISLGG